MSSAINSHSGGQFYVEKYLGFSWVDNAGAVINPPAALDDGTGKMWFNSEEVKDIAEGLGIESVTYVLGNGTSAQQARPQPRTWACVVSRTSPATDQKLDTLRTYLAAGHVPSAFLQSGYYAGDAAAGDWSAQTPSMSPCTIEFTQQQARNIGRGQGILTAIAVQLTIRQGTTLVLPSASSGSGGSGGSGA